MLKFLMLLGSTRFYFLVIACRYILYSLQLPSDMWAPFPISCTAHHVSHNEQTNLAAAVVSLLFSVFHHQTSTVQRPGSMSNKGALNVTGLNTRGVTGVGPHTSLPFPAPSGTGLLSQFHQRLSSRVHSPSRAVSRGMAAPTAHSTRSNSAPRAVRCAALSCAPSRRPARSRRLSLDAVTSPWLLSSRSELRLCRGAAPLPAGRVACRREARFAPRRRQQDTVGVIAD